MTGKFSMVGVSQPTGIKSYKLRRSTDLWKPENRQAAPGCTGVGSESNEICTNTIVYAYRVSTDTGVLIGSFNRRGNGVLFDAKASRCNRNRVRVEWNVSDQKFCIRPKSYGIRMYEP